MRSTDQRLLIKLSVSPFDGILDKLAASSDRRSDATDPAEQQDWSRIDLMPTNRQRARELENFSVAMFNRLRDEFKLGAVTPEQVFGPSDILHDVDISEEALATTVISHDPRKKVKKFSIARFSPEGIHGKRFRELAMRDPTFLAYLAKNELDLNSLHLLSEKRKTETVRKIIAVVAVREKFFEGLSLEQRSDRRMLRNKPEKRIGNEYLGARALFAMCEGNPRWLLGVLRPLLSTYADQQRDNKGGPVPYHIQASRIQSTLAVFLSIISTIRIPAGAGRSFRTANDLIAVVADYFSGSVLAETFNPDPILSFTVDDGLPEGLKEAVGRAINQGAFVWVPSASPFKQVKLGSISNQVYRLSYLLAPLYQIPIRKGRPINLSTIIEGSEKGPAEDLLAFMREML